MKKIFLFTAAIVAAMTVNAQEDKSWNFTELFPNADAAKDVKFTAPAEGVVPPADALVPGELYVYGNKNKAWAMDYNQSGKLFVDFLTPEESIVTGVDDKGFPIIKQTRLKSGGTGSVKDGVFKGAIAFCVAGDSYIQIAAVSSSGSAVRKMNIVNLDGTVLESFFFDGNIGKRVDGEIVTPPFEYEYEGPATTLFIISAEAVEGDDSYAAGGINYYKIAATNVAPWSAPQGIEDIFTGGKAVKFFENGQLIIIKNGVKFNALGTRL